MNILNIYIKTMHIYIIDDKMEHCHLEYNHMWCNSKSQYLNQKDKSCGANLFLVTGNTPPLRT